MNRIEKMLLVFALVGLSCNIHAITAENRYETITDRNIFRLNPPPTNSPTNITEVVPDRKVDLSGISIIGKLKKAWLVVAPKAGSKDSPLYLNLAEGEMADFLSIVSINEQQGEVKVINGGNPMVLSLKTNILKALPVAALPGQAVAPVANTLIPPPTPQSTTATYGSGGTPSYAGRGAVTVSGGSPALPSVGGQTADNGGLRSIPTRTLRLAPVASQPAPVQNEKQPDPLTQRVLMEVQQEHAKQSGQQLPPLPPLPQ